MIKSRMIWKRVVALVLTLALVITSAVVPKTEVSAAPAKAVKKVTLKVGSKNVTKKTITVEKGKKSKIKVVVKPAKAKKKVAFKSSNKNVAAVNKKGVVTAKKKGTAKITVTVTGKNKKKKKAWMKVKVTEKETTTPSEQKPSETTNNTANDTTSDNTVAVTGVTATILPSENIVAGQSAQIVASVQPANATDSTLKYTSSNTNVAAVNEVGAVTGINAGTAIITITSTNGKTAYVTVTVVEVKATEVKLDQTVAELTVTSTTSLKATVLPSDVKDKTIVWSSEDTSIASVDQNGVVTGVNPGTTTIKALNEKSGLFAECVVTVKSNSILADGITAEVTNPYVDNVGTEYTNTVLVGDDMNVRVRVVKDGQPLGNANVNLKMERLYGNSSGYFEIRQDYLTTDANGYANFAIGLKSTYSSVDAVSGRYQSYTLTATEVSSNQKVNITVKFGSIVLNGISVENNINPLYQDIEPSDNASPFDTGIWTSHSVDGKKIEKYVSSQTVSSYEDDHKVYFNAEPELILPATSENAHLGDWEVKFPTSAADGDSGSYSVYNTDSNMTTTTVVEDVPAGLRYITLTFDKLNLSKYTAMYIDLYSEAGDSLFHKEVTNINNSDVNQGIQITWQSDTNCRIVVSLVSQGQVEVSNEGYVLSKISGPWATTNDELTTSYAIENSVTWTDVTTDVIYETKEWSYAEAEEYLPSDSVFLNSTYKYSYRIPVFPYTGDAVITVKDANDKVKAYYLYPTENPRGYDTNGNITYKNVNELAAPSSRIYAILATEEEVTQTVTGSLKTSGNQAVVDTERTGMTALMATVNVNGLEQSELNEQNGGKMYTSVQWAPVPKKTAEEILPEFYAIEGQRVTVTAQLYDKNNNLKTTAGESIKFTYLDGDEEVEITKASQEIGGTDATDTVTVISFMQSTNEKGQVIIELYGMGTDFVEGLTAESSDYNVGLSFEADVATDINLTKGNIYWVDLGTAFVDSAVMSENPVRTSNFNTSIDMIQKSSASEVGKVWNVGYLPIARSHKFDYSKTSDVSEDVLKEYEEFISVENVSIAYDKSGKGTLTHENGVATITSTEIGNTEINGYIDVESMLPENVVFNFYNENGDIVSYKNIGQGTPNVDNTGLKLTMAWTLSGMQAEIITPNGTSVDIYTDTTVYVQVLDNYGNKVENATVSYTMNISGTEKTGSGTTNDKGIFAINIAAPKKVVNCAITINVGDDISKDVTINYIDTADKEFGIMEDATDSYAVEIVSDNQLKLYFTNRINKSTLKAGQFKFQQVGSTDIQYNVENAEISSDNNAIIITLDKAIENKMASHTVTVDSYEDKLGVVYELMDTFGQKITGDASYTFIPSEIVSE